MVAVAFSRNKIVFREVLKIFKKTNPVFCFFLNLFPKFIWFDTLWNYLCIFFVLTKIVEFEKSQNQPRKTKFFDFLADFLTWSPSSLTNQTLSPNQNNQHYSDSISDLQRAIFGTRTLWTKFFGQGGRPRPNLLALQW